MEHSPEPGSREEIFAILRELPVAAVKAVGHGLLRLVGLEQRHEPFPGPMTDEEARRENSRSGFPRNYRM